MLHQALEPYVDAIQKIPSPHPQTQAPAVRRAQYREIAQALRGEPEAMTSVRDDVIDLGDRVLATRLYVPLGEEEKAFVIFFHGGSFIVGDLDTHDALCRRLSSDTKMRFLAIDYRLAPEHPFPAALNDAVDVIHYVHENLSHFALEGTPLIVMGDSAGASLMTVAATLTRNEDLDIVAQVLIYPTLGPDVVTESSHHFGVGYFLDLDHLRYDYAQYLGSFFDHTDPRVTPLMSSDLRGAPPAIVLVAECDPLRDEGVAYAGLLEHFGVRVELLEAEGMVHGFLRLGALVPEALQIVDDLARHMHDFATGNAS